MVVDAETRFRKRLSSLNLDDVKKSGRTDSIHPGLGGGPVALEDGRVCLLFAMRESVGALKRALAIFEKHGISLSHIESRPSKRDKSYDFLVETANKDQNLEACCEELKLHTTRFQITAHRHQEGIEDQIPWFPLKISDLDHFANRVLSYGRELDSEHPGFTDEAYRKRRSYFADNAFNYKHGQSIPTVEYTPEEIATWGQVYRSLTSLYPTHACREFNYIFPLLQENCGYREDNIPQLQDVSNFLKDCTGFTLRPVAGLLSSRDFLAGLAFRVFHSTQYVRHPSVPSYTPEPDVCHELLGHAPLFADPAFAQFSQEIGLASLGAPDDYIKKLATCYWFTVEFGICMQEGEHKAYGAGLLSSYAELEYCLSGKPELEAFEPEITGVTEYPITAYQPKYFVAQSFESSMHKVMHFAKTIPRPFTVRYNPYTQSIDLINSSNQIKGILRDLNYEIKTLMDAVDVVNKLRD
ncbi:unnamed protein product [Cyprideis torosa]|uniref:phenylalanine 4-monooxygenase n=1 Tax=Cyprideis torosa TaxID=163714 RepID=A0A7R8WJL7_9CRUS|nr:unnamed protein product [Cyprideis torosa]CAG0895828.1 unnamed protein product [Cyprideis torosa]